jgi:hypothetical protein
MEGPLIAKAGGWVLDVKGTQGLVCPRYLLLWVRESDLTG